MRSADSKVILTHTLTPRMKVNLITGFPGEEGPGEWGEGCRGEWGGGCLSGSPDNKGSPESGLLKNIYVYNILIILNFAFFKTSMLCDLLIKYVFINV